VKWPRTNRTRPYEPAELHPDARPSTSPQPETVIGTALNAFKSRRSVGVNERGNPAYWCLFCLTPVATVATTYCDRHRSLHQRARRRKRNVAEQSHPTPAPVLLTQDQVNHLAATALSLATTSAAVARGLQLRSEQVRTVEEFRGTHRADLTTMFKTTDTLNRLLAALAQQHTVQQPET
jgi:hypothetical protein